MLNAIRKFFAKTVADITFASGPIQPIQPMPTGFYRMRNGERVRIKVEDDALVRAFGCEMPSAISLRWRMDGRYVSSRKEHPFDLVDFEGDWI